MTDISTEIPEITIGDYTVQFLSTAVSWVDCIAYVNEFGDVLAPKALDDPASNSIMGGSKLIFYGLVYDRTKAVFGDVVQAEEFLNAMRDRSPHSTYRLTRSVKITEVMHA